MYHEKEHSGKQRIPIRFCMMKGSDVSFETHRHSFFLLVVTPLGVVVNLAQISPFNEIFEKLGFLGYGKYFEML